MPSLIVNEIFHSIQGESSHAGRPCVFVRLTGCSLRCRYCDTRHAFFAGSTWGLDALVRHVASFGCRLVEVTGGEPLEQEETPRLLRALVDAGHEVLLETSGALPIAALDPRVAIILDVKTPGSGMADRNYLAALDDLKPGIDEVKFVVADRDDFDWALDLAGRQRLFSRVTVLVAPVFGEVEPAALADWVLQSGARFRLNLPLHKTLWSPTARGV